MSPEQVRAITMNDRSLLLLVAEIAVFVQTLVDDAFQFYWYFGIQPDWRGRRGIEDGLENDSRAFAPERHHTGCHFVENSAEGEQVGAGIKFFRRGSG